jgi:hypothetical protein
MSPKPADYLQNAEECRRLARMLNMPEHRETLLHMAATWEKLASERKRNSGRAVAAKQGTPLVSRWPKNE